MGPEHCALGRVEERLQDEAPEADDVDELGPQNPHEEVQVPDAAREKVDGWNFPGGRHRERKVPEK